MTVSLTLPRRITLPVPADAIAAGLAGSGLLAGFLLRAFPFADYLYLTAMICGGSVAIPPAVDALRRWRLDVHVLMLVAAIGAAAIGRPGEGAMLLFLFALSGALEQFALGRTKDAIRGLIKLRPTQARLATGEMVAVEAIQPGQIIVVHPAEAIPVDGEVIDGVSSVDQSSMTGESEPISRSTGDRVVTGTLNLDGILTVRATSACKDSALERVIALVAAAQDEKSLASSERLADRVGLYYAPLVMGGALVWYLAARFVFATDHDAATYRALTLLVAASPCALVLSSPAAILSALAAAGRRGLLVRSGSVLEMLARVDTIAFDKTGTLTTAVPHLIGIWTSDANDDGLLAAAAGAEMPVPHPLAKALVRAAHDKSLQVPVTSSHKVVPGKGIVAEIDGSEIRVGRPEWVFDDRFDAELQERVAGVRAAGESVAAIRYGDAFGLARFGDTLRADAASSLRRLNDLGVHNLVMLTGDHEEAALAVNRQIPLTGVHAGLSPEDKAHWIGKTTRSGHVVAMVGDGVNDAPALAGSGVGITLGGIGSDVALDSADVVIMEDRLSAVPDAIALARRARKVAMQNVIFSLAGVTLLTLTVVIRQIALPWAVVFHEGATVIVVLNGVRLMWRS
jgi:Cd2+/Zn2+-exporting ATPase